MSHRWRRWRRGGVRGAGGGRVSENHQLQGVGKGGLQGAGRPEGGLRLVHAEKTRILFPFKLDGI